MYLATLSDLDNEPVLIWDEFVATDKSEIKVSSVSPDRCEIIVLKSFFCAKLITSKVSLTVPIWFNLTNIELADFSSIPFFNLFIFVANKSSPTICILVLLVSFFQESQSSSLKGSSIDLIGYFLINSK